MRMCLVRSIMGLLLLGLVQGTLSCRERTPPPAPPREGLALAIVYDTSGSMADSVYNAQGRSEAKYLVARRAMGDILDQLAEYALATNAGMPRVVEVELITLDRTRTRTPIPLQAFDVQVFKNWINTFHRPDGGTPLGVAVREASEDLLASPLTRKHILVLTDGENTEGPAPEHIIAGLQARTKEAGIDLYIHFVAFDVAAERFNPIKKWGCTVVSATDETQLKDQLDYILHKKILLENEE